MITIKIISAAGNAPGPMSQKLNISHTKLIAAIETHVSY